MHKLALSALLAIFSLTSTVALAQTTLQSAIHNVPTAPVQITACSGTLDDTEAGNIDYTFHPRAQYHNRTLRAVKAVRLRFDLLNSFDEHLESKYGIDGDGIDPNGNQRGSWSWIVFPQATSELRCSIETVKFTDGTSWSAK